jgi:hypothetical protein
MVRVLYGLFGVVVCRGRVALFVRARSSALLCASPRGAARVPAVARLLPAYPAHLLADLCRSPRIMSRTATATVEEEAVEERNEQHYEEIEKLQEMVARAPLHTHACTRICARTLGRASDELVCACASMSGRVGRAGLLTRLLAPRLWSRRALAALYALIDSTGHQCDG